MSFRYQKRIGLGKGLGLNVSKSGVSTSYRSKSGSIGTRGFSIKTGIPGLTYRGSWGRNKEGFIIMLTVFLVAGVFLIVWNILRFLLHISVRGVQIVREKFQK